MTIFDFSSLGFQSEEMAVVTGAGNGIGRSVALMLAKSGVAVAAWDIEKEGLEEVVAEIVTAGGTAFPVLADLSEQSGVDSAWEQTGALDRPVQYLVNNAGPPSTTDMPVSEGVRISSGAMQQSLRASWPDMPTVLPAPLLLHRSPETLWSAARWIGIPQRKPG